MRLFLIKIYNFLFFKPKPVVETEWREYKFVSELDFRNEFLVGNDVIIHKGTVDHMLREVRQLVENKKEVKISLTVFYDTVLEEYYCTTFTMHLDSWNGFHSFYPDILANIVQSAVMPITPTEWNSSIFSDIRKIRIELTLRRKESPGAELSKNAKKVQEGPREYDDVH